MQKLDRLLSIPIAHRGLHDEVFEENSMSAFRAAVEHGFAIETDVHLLKDGVVAVFHDDNIKRICGKDVIIETLTSAELKNYPMLQGGEIIPTLPEMLSLIKGQVPILIELKTLKGIVNNDLAKAVLRDLKNYPYEDCIALQSFDLFAVKWVRKHQNIYPYGQLSSMAIDKDSKTPKILAKYMGKLMCNRISKPMFTSYDIATSPNKYIAEVKKKMPVISWTIRNLTELELAKSVGDNIIFEKIPPELAKTFKK